MPSLKQCRCHVPTTNNNDPLKISTIDLISFSELTIYRDIGHTLFLMWRLWSRLNRKGSNCLISIFLFDVEKAVDFGYSE